MTSPLRGAKEGNTEFLAAFQLVNAAAPAPAPAAAEEEDANDEFAPPAGEPR